jgi:hypothetical protein
MTVFVRVLNTRIEPEEVPTKICLPDKSNRAVIMAELLVCFIGGRTYDTKNKHKLTVACSPESHRSRTTQSDLDVPYGDRRRTRRLRSKVQE